MAYVSREIKDRVAIGDNCFYMEELELCFNPLRIELYG